MTGGTAYATHPGGASTISSGDIIDNDVRAVDIRTNAVQTSEIDGNAVNSAKIAGGGVTTTDVRNGDLFGADLAADTVTGANVDESTLSGVQRTGASGLSTGGGGTVTTEEQSVEFPVADGTFTYSCFVTNALESWAGPQAEIWIDQGDANPSHFNTTGFEGAIGSNGGDRYTHVFTTADLVSELELYSHSTGTECHYAYTLTEYER